MRTWILWLLIYSPHGEVHPIDIEPDPKPYLTEEACKRAGGEAVAAWTNVFKAIGATDYAILYKCTGTPLLLPKPDKITI